MIKVGMDVMSNKLINKLFIVSCLLLSFPGYLPSLFFVHFINIDYCCFLLVEVYFLWIKICLSSSLRRQCTCNSPTETVTTGHNIGAV